MVLKALASLKICSFQKSSPQLSHFHVRLVQLQLVLFQNLRHLPDPGALIFVSNLQSGKLVLHLLHPFTQFIQLAILHILIVIMACLIGHFYEIINNIFIIII